MTYAYPSEMPRQEAEAYVNRAKRKYGESNLRHVEIELLGGDIVETKISLVEGARERIRRLSPETVAELAKGA